MENVTEDTFIRHAIYSNASDLSSVVSTPTSGCVSEEDSSETGFVPSSIIEKQIKLSDDASLENLNNAILECKKLVLNSRECSEERKWLVRYLVELRYRAQELKDAGENIPNKMGVSVAGHHFKQYDNANSTVKQYCDHCSGVIWSVMQGSYICRDCAYICHSKCVNKVIRICVHVVTSEKGALEMNICAEVGLAAQRYRCAECGTNLGFDGRWSEPRLCDYSGLYYCATCHWNNVYEIPARIVHNWDWDKRQVSQAAYQLLTLTRDKPLINLEDANKHLFLFVADLDFIRKMRSDLLLMRQYLIECHIGNNLISRDMLYMAETPNLYSIADLEMAKDGILETRLNVLTEKCRAHIIECLVCRGKGYRCELCTNKTVMFPFDSSATGCGKCNSVYHRACYIRVNQVCPKCIRLAKRYRNIEMDP